MTVVSFKCPNCDGELVFDPASQKFHCGYCLSDFTKQELDAQPVQGENIISSKQEIEKTLDTLNTAFEKLLDELFQDTAWDLSSDISVLNTMLAQEGLTEDGLKTGRKR